MKTLYLVRHAKSSWKYEDLSDFDRPLNKRGRRDAPLMGRVLKQQKIRPELLVSSPANRAISAARMIAAEIGYAAEDIRSEERIYHASCTELLMLIRETNDSVGSLMMVGHNPGLTDVSNLLCDRYLDNIPTTGIVRIAFAIDSWRELAQGAGTMTAFEYPKKYIES